MRKICSKCKKEKPLSEFNLNNTKKDGHQGCCVLCQKEYGRSHYQKDSDRYKERARKRTKEIRKFRDGYKEDKYCIICGYNKCITALEFHHPGKKKDNISKLMGGGYSLARIKEELKRCDIVCANCHREIHWVAGEIGITPLSKSEVRGS